MSPSARAEAVTRSIVEQARILRTMSSMQVTRVDQRAVVSAIHLAFDQHARASGWTAAARATRAVLERVTAKLGVSPTRFHYVSGMCAVLLVWEVHHETLVVTVYLDGEVGWTLSHERLFLYEEIDGGGMGASFERVLHRMNQVREQTRC